MGSCRLADAAAVMGGLTALKQESPEEYWRLIQNQAGRCAIRAAAGATSACGLLEGALDLVDVVLVALAVPLTPTLPLGPLLQS